jgi:hypothetical protein
MQSRLSEVSGVGPHSFCTQKHYQPNRSTNFIKITISAMRRKIVENIKTCFTEVRIHCLLPKLLLKHSGSYSPLRNSLGCEFIPPHFHWVGSSSNHFPTSLSLLLPLRRRSATCTNFLQLITRLGARWATSNRLGGKTSKSNKCETHDFSQRSILPGTSGFLYPELPSFQTN